MSTQIQLRRGTAAAWTSADTILAAGEVGVETDTGQFKIGDGATAWTSLGYAGGMTLDPPDIQVFTAGTGQTWNKPAGARYVRVRVIGGGASGGGTQATGAGARAASGGGGAGGYAEKVFDATALAASETVDVGSGGSAPAAGNNDGTNGGTSNFATGKAYIVTAGGGVKGTGSATSTGAQSNAGGAGGSASGGDLNMPGGSGMPGVVVSGPTTTSFGHGGVSALGANGVLMGNGNPNAGSLYGGGGSGNSQGASSSAGAGAAGANGVVIVETYF